MPVWHIWGDTGEGKDATKKQSQTTELFYGWKQNLTNLTYLIQNFT